MADRLLFAGRVALVTGAGAGLGREYALLLGSRGAKVVVNDLGGDIKGEGKSSRAADKVVDEIRSAGGIAVANYDSVENGDSLVQTALDNFGRLDILINNAGILRDRSFARTSDLDWDLVHRVHLRGSFLVTRAAWPHMKSNGFGRIIMTTSAAGIYGNFGQANYSAAKLGLLGLSNTLAIEGQKYNIHCNTVAPIAGSRLTATVMPQELLDALKPKYVAPLVAWLCHEHCEETGTVYEVGGGHVAKLRWQKSDGAVVRRKGKEMTIEDVRDSWEQISDFTEPSYPASIGESNARIYQVLQEIDEQPITRRRLTKNNLSAIEPDKAIGKQLTGNDFTYEAKDVILYALGVGASTSQPDHLKFLFELNEDFCVVPSFGVIPSMTVGSGMFTGQVEGLSVDPTKILHGEQYLELYKPLPTNATLRSKGEIAEVLDKGSGALIALNIHTFDETGDKVAFNQFITFVQKAGGFGGKRSSDKLIPTQNPPKRPPDATMKETTSIDQAAIYRLTGDRNPLHIDPAFAALGGFQKPILHGLASFGFAVRHVMKQYCDNDVTRFKAVKVRFSGPVVPGQTIATDMWKDGNRVYFQSKVAETGKPCISGAYVDLKPSETDSSGGSGDSGPSGRPCDMVFEAIQQHVQQDPSLVKKVNAIFLWNITEGSKTVAQWTVDLKNGPGAVYRGEPQQGKPGCTMTASENVFVKMASGELNGQQAFLQGKLKLKGNIMLAQKLGVLFAREAKL